MRQNISIIFYRIPDLWLKAWGDDSHRDCFISPLRKDSLELAHVHFSFMLIFKDLGQTCPSFMEKWQWQLPNQQTKPGKKWARELAEELHKLLEP